MPYYEPQEAFLRHLRPDQACSGRAGGRQGWLQSGNPQRQTRDIR